MMSGDQVDMKGQHITRLQSQNVVAIVGPLIPSAQVRVALVVGIGQCYRILDRTSGVWTNEKRCQD